MSYFFAESFFDFALRQNYCKIKRFNGMVDEKGGVKQK